MTDSVNKPVLLSLIIPVRKSYDRLTVLLQTFDLTHLSMLEVVIVRDHDDPPPSNFETSANIRVVVAKTTGLGPARNFGLDHVSGQYIAFCDCDDTLDLKQLLAITHEMEAAGCDLALTAYDKLHEDGTRTRHDPSGGLSPGVICDYSDRARMSKGFYFCWNKVYRHDYIKAINLTYPSGEYEDVYWSVLAIAQANKIYVSDQSFYGYRQLATSAVNRAGRQHLDIIRQYKAAIAVLARHDLPASFIQAVWLKATRHILFVICGANRLEYADRRALFYHLHAGIRTGPGIGAIMGAHSLSTFNKTALLLRSSSLLELKRLIVSQR